MATKPSFLRRHKAIIFTLLTVLNLALAATLLVNSSVAQGDEDRAELESAFFEGRDALLEGQYASARRAFNKIVSDEKEFETLTKAEYDRAATYLARTYFEMGEYDRAIRTLKSRCAPRSVLAGDAGRAMAVEYARILKYTGKTDDAMTVVARVQVEFGNDPENLALLGQMLYEAGKEDEAMQAFLAITQFVAANPAAMSGEGEEVSRRWVAVGKAYYFADRIRRESRLNDALQAFIKAKQADATNLEALVWGGKVSIEGNKQANARRDWLMPALKQNASFAPARVEVARSWFFEWSSYRGASEAWTAYRLSPDSIEALLGMVEAKIADQRYSQGWEYLDKALKINPNALEVLTTKALLHLFSGQRDKFAETETRVLELNARYSEFYAKIADGLKDQHRFDEAIEMGEKGLKLDANDWDIHKVLGFVYARMGQNEKAQKYLLDANRHDPLRNNLFTLNLLQVLRVIQESFVEHKTADGNFIIRVNQKEADWLLPLLERDLAWAFDALTEKYGFTPKVPIIVEAFHRHDDFAARSVALPGLPALGVCFGQYLTIDSPSAREPGQFSWARTLRHEMDHIYQIQLSKGRVPRWLAEGCSVYEERRTRPEWDRELDQQMIQFYHQDRLMKLADINNAFRNMGTIMFAYYQSSYMVEFIDSELGGMGKVSQMLRDFGDDHSVEQVINDNFDLSLEAFDTKFREYVERNFIKATKLLPFYGPDDLQRFKMEFEDNPEDPDLRAKLGAAYLHNGFNVDAKLHTGIALRLDPNNLLAIVTMGRILFAEAAASNSDEIMVEAIDYYERALREGVEDFFLYLHMAQVYIREGDNNAAIEFLNMAKEAFPRFVGEGNPYVTLFQIYQQQGNMAAALAELEDFCTINELAVEPRQQLFGIYLRNGNIKRALNLLEEIEAVVPGDPALHMQLGELLMRQGYFRDAAIQFRTAAGFHDPQTENRANLDQARAFLAAGDYDAADGALGKVTAVMPDNPDAQRVKEAIATARLNNPNGEVDVPLRDRSPIPDDGRRPFRPGNRPPNNPDNPDNNPNPQDPDTNPNNPNQPNNGEEF